MLRKSTANKELEIRAQVIETSLFIVKNPRNEVHVLSVMTMKPHRMIIKGKKAYYAQG